VCDLETSRIGAPYIYIYDISRLRVNRVAQRAAKFFQPGRKIKRVFLCFVTQHQ